MLEGMAASTWRCRVHTACRRRKMAGQKGVQTWAGGSRLLSAILPYWNQVHRKQGGSCLLLQLLRFPACGIKDSSTTLKKHRILYATLKVHVVLWICFFPFRQAVFLPGPFSVLTKFIMGSSLPRRAREASSSFSRFLCHDDGGMVMCWKQENGWMARLTSDLVLMFSWSGCEAATEKQVALINACFLRHREWALYLGKEFFFAFFSCFRNDRRYGNLFQ